MTSPAKTYDMLVRPITVAVRSESGPAKTYEVHLPYCPCPDFEYRRGNGTGDVCKHIRQAMAAVAGWHDQPEPETFRDLNVSQAFDRLTWSGVNGGEAERVLHEAGRTGCASAGLPGGGSLPVRHSDGYYEVTITA
jgi:hypothetical protein